MHGPLFRHTHRNAALWQPAADIYRTPDGFLVKFDLAGVSADEVSIDISGHHLTLSGTRRDAIVETGVRHHSLEICYSRFERTLRFPCPLDRAQFSVNQCDGMLLVRITME